MNVAPIATLQRYLQTPRLAWDFLALHEPEPWDDYFALADLPRAAGADFTVGERRYGLYAHDFRRVPVDDAIADGEPIDDPVSYRFAADVRRRYERMRRLPDGFLVMGDAICSFNPIYGQGMTVAALQASALREHLPLNCGGTRRVFRALAREIDVPWQMTTSADLAVPGVEGRRTPAVRLANGYVSRLQRAAARDASLTRAFVRVTGLVDRPPALMRPRVAARVARGAPRRG